MNKFFKVNMGAEGWGLLVNEGTLKEPKFRILLKGTERWMERMADHLNEGRPEAIRLLEQNRPDENEGNPIALF